MRRLLTLAEHIYYGAEEALSSYPVEGLKKLEEKLLKGIKEEIDSLPESEETEKEAGENFTGTTGTDK